MEDVGGLISLVFNCGLPVVLLLLGLFVGRTVERAHLRRLDRAEATLLTIPLTDIKALPQGVVGGGALMVTGSVVVASDYLKTFLASLRKIIGGEVRSFERLMERARREAICRMMGEAHAHGAVAVLNLRLETSNIGAMRRKRVSPMVEVIAYGTAVLPVGTPAQAIDVAVPCPECEYLLTATDVPGCPECGWNRRDPSHGSGPDGRA